MLEILPPMEYWSDMVLVGELQLCAALALGFAMLFVFPQISMLGLIGALKNLAGLFAIMYFPPSIFIILGFLIHNYIKYGQVLKSWHLSHVRLEVEAEMAAKKNRGY